MASHLRLPLANFAVVVQSPLACVSRFVREKFLGEDDHFVLQVDPDEDPEVQAIPAQS